MSSRSDSQRSKLRTNRAESRPGTASSTVPVALDSSVSHLSSGPSELPGTMVDSSLIHCTSDSSICPTLFISPSALAGPSQLHSLSAGYLAVHSDQNYVASSRLGTIPTQVNADSVSYIQKYTEKSLKTIPAIKRAYDAAKAASPRVNLRPKMALLKSMPWHTDAMIYPGNLYSWLAGILVRQRPEPASTVRAFSNICIRPLLKRVHPVSCFIDFRKIDGSIIERRGASSKD